MAAECRRRHHPPYSANLDLAVAGGEAWVSSFKADRVYHVPVP